MATNDALTARQRRFVLELTTASSVRDAAHKAGIAERTAWRYLSSEAVQHALTTHYDIALRELGRGMAVVMSEAMDTVLGILRDAKTSPSVRVSAARVILDSGLRLAELVTLAGRVTKLEERVAAAESSSARTDLRAAGIDKGEA